MRRPVTVASSRTARQAVPSGAAARHAIAPLPAPLRGWIENENLAANQGVGCSVLENFVPTTQSVRVRGGSLLKTTLPAAAEGFINYRTGAAEKLFASTASAIYDVSLFPTIAGAAIWTQVTTGRWTSTQMAIAGVEYVVAVNGRDLMIYYDGTNLNPVTTTEVKNLNYDTATQAFVVGRGLTGGTSGATGIIVGVIPTSATAGKLKLRSVSGTFVNDEAITGSASGGAALVQGVPSSASAITLTGVLTSALSHVWQHGSRLWFIQGGTTKAWYLPVDSIGGTATSYDFGGLLAKGGALLFGATWSSDSGSGFQDRCVFVSDQGEVVVFSGTDPSSPSTWGRQGTYQIGRPISKQTIQAGGDLIISTEDGMIPMSAIVTADRSALASQAITAAIEAPWRRNNATNTSTATPQVIKWPSQSIGFVGWPHREGGESFVVNLITGAWAKWTGLDMQCLTLYQGWAYFGNAAGEIYQLEASGYDGDQSYICRMSWLPQPLQADASFKIVTQVRATFRSRVPFNPKLSVAQDYGRNFPAPPSVPLDAGTLALWDVGVFDVSRFDDGPDSEERVTAVTQWVAVGAAGVAVSPQLQITGGGERMLDAELVAYDVAYLVGGYVV